MECITRIPIDVYQGFKKFIITDTIYNCFYTLDKNNNSMNDNNSKNIGRFMMTLYNYSLNKKLILNFIDDTNNKNIFNELPPNDEYADINRVNFNNDNNKVIKVNRIENKQTKDITLYNDKYLLIGPYGGMLYICDLTLYLIKKIKLGENYALSNKYLFTNYEIYSMDTLESIYTYEKQINHSKRKKILCSEKFIVVELADNTYTMYNTKTKEHIVINGYPISMENNLLYVKTPLNGIELQTPKSINMECIICYEEIMERYAIVPCGHTNICKKCLDENNINTCPTCNDVIIKQIKLYL